jgi:hypothetical protein
MTCSQIQFAHYLSSVFVAGEVQGCLASVSMVGVVLGYSSLVSVVGVVLGCLASVSVVGVVLGCLASVSVVGVMLGCLALVYVGIALGFLLLPWVGESVGVSVVGEVAVSPGCVFALTEEMGDLGVEGRVFVSGGTYVCTSNICRGCRINLAVCLHRILAYMLGEEDDIVEGRILELLDFQSMIVYSFLWYLQIIVRIDRRSVVCSCGVCPQTLPLLCTAIGKKLFTRSSTFLL